MFNKIKFLFFTMLISASAIFSQITITSADAAAFYSTGNTWTVHGDTNATMVDIGTPGGGNSWDFSGFMSNFMLSYSSVDPSSTPYAGDFPGAEIAFYYANNMGGAPIETWAYQSLDPDFLFYGNVTKSEPIPGFASTTTATYDPPEKTFQFPLTFGTSWSMSGSVEIVSEISGFPSTTTNESYTVSYEVDAYGTMTLPSTKKAVNALRIRSDERTNIMSGGGTIYVRTISYTFLGKSGENFSFSAEDTTAANSGMIEINSASWVNALTTSVDDEDLAVSDFNLSENYPNPFNPTTNLEITIPERTFVTLKVYNSLGEEVASLISEEMPAGTYVRTFDAANLSSGTYFARISAGDYNNTVKMILIK